MKKLFLTALAGALIGSASLALAAGDLAAGQQKSVTCAACHGADGNSVNPEWPRLAGQNAEYLYKQLQEFKAGTRTNATMAPMAAMLSDQDMQDVATYFASQKPARGEADPKLVEIGQAVWRGGDLERGVPACIACHGVSGGGNEGAKFPALAGQHAKYTEAQLLAFRAMSRGNDPAQMMRSIASRMTDAQIKAVSSYIQGLQ